MTKLWRKLFTSKLTTSKYVVEAVDLASSSYNNTPAGMIDIRILNGVMQYRYKYPYKFDPIKSYPPEDWHWSEWKAVEIINTSNTINLI